MKYVIKVTEECINSGVPGNPCTCPIARALENLGFKGYGVTNEYIRIWDDDNGSLYCRVTPEVRSFVNDFDDYKKVQPFEFVLDTDVLNPDYYCSSADL